MKTQDGPLGLGQIPRATEPNHGWVVHPEFLRGLVRDIKEQGHADVPGMEEAERVIVRLVELGCAGLAPEASR